MAVLGLAVGDLVVEVCLSHGLLVRCEHLLNEILRQRSHRLSCQAIFSLAILLSFLLKVLGLIEKFASLSSCLIHEGDATGAHLMTFFLGRASGRRWYSIAIEG